MEFKEIQKVTKMVLIQFKLKYKTFYFILVWMSVYM